MKKKITSQLWLILLLLLPVISMAQQKSVPPDSDTSDKDKPRIQIKEIIKNAGEAFRPDFSQDRVDREVIVKLDTAEHNSIKSLIRYWQNEYQIREENVVRIDSCNCGKLIFLVEFDTPENAKKVWIPLSRIVGTSKSTEVDGNKLIDIGWTKEKEGYELLNNELHKAEFERMVTVYLLDSGVDTRGWNKSSKFIKGNAPKYDCLGNVPPSAGYNYVCPNKVNHRYMDYNGHGTFGMRAITENMETDSLRIIPLKIFNRKGKGTFFGMVCAMYHAIDYGADIINLSGGYKALPSDFSPIMEGVLLEALENDVFIVAAAGNNNVNWDTDINKERRYPAAYSDRLLIRNQDTIKLSNIISVAALNLKNGSRSGFSAHGSRVQVATFGESVLGYACNGRKFVGNGTSVATYYVTKILAAEIGNCRQKDRCRTVREDFMKTLDDCGSNVAQKCYFFNDNNEVIRLPLGLRFMNTININTNREFE